MKQFGDDNVKVHVNGRKFSKKVENTVGNSSPPSVFSKDLYPKHIKTRVCFEKG